MNAKVNKRLCIETGEILKDLQIKESFKHREFISFDADRETKLRVYFLSAAICHQTHHLHHPSKNLWGWDYMEFGFLNLMKARNPILNPGYMSICAEPDIESILKKTFSNDGNPDNTSLDRVEERTNLLLDICRNVKQKYKGRISELIDYSAGRLINEGNGIYENLQQFQAFTDPLKKKITFFIKLAVDAGILTIKDQEQIIPIMDYHMQRVLLRTGCVEIEDADYRKRLIAREQLSSDEPVRSTCVKALKIIAKTSGHNILAMNDLFWPIGRSCCNETTLCTDHRCAKDPCTLFQMVNLDNHYQCVFEDICLGKKKKQYRYLWEPEVVTHFY